jgi:serine phosphatase RsbU (regulator of sigma subunit)
MSDNFKKSAPNPNWLVNLDKIEDSTRKNYFAGLPPEQSLVEKFSQAFVLNKPKGHVGGDGFWLHTHEDDVYLALFTCVGEGHLASMMIRIYMSALKKMVEEYSIDFTGSILQFLHREVQARFKNKNNILLNTNANMGIVKLNTKTKAMEFAGANMNLMQMHGNDIKIIEGDSHQVGESGEQRLSYSSINLENTADSSFYLFSSGIFNLIGGPSFKKLNVEDIGSFLTKRKKVSMGQQKEQVLEFLMNWTGASRQNDDIMMIGFKA